MPFVIDNIVTEKLSLNNQEVNLNGIGITYQKLNKNWSYTTVGATEIVIDSILVPANFSCGSLTPYVNFIGNLDTNEYENLTFKIYLNESPVLDGNEILISRPDIRAEQEVGVADVPIGIGSSSTFSFGASFLDNILSNISYSYIEQNKTTIDYLESSQVLGGNYTFGSVETYDCTKQYYAILTASASNVGVASLVVTLDKSGGRRLL